MLGKIGRRFSLQAPPEKSTWGPLLVCIVPHGCGKTCFIRGLGEKVYEINTEEAKGLYESVALSSIWNLWADGAQSPTKQNLNSRVIYGLSLHDRILSLKSTELYLAVMLFSKQMKYDDFRTHVLSVIDGRVPETTVEVYLKTVEEIVHTEGTKMTTASIDLFVPEAVQDCRNNSLTDLKKAIKTEPSVLCWSSNTLASNEPSGFQDILTIAVKYQRVVRFVRWGQELPRVSFAEIVKRNVLKFLRTGRLIPLHELYRAYQQCEETFKSGQLNHVDVARMAGFIMDDMGRISEIVPSGNSPRKPSAVDSTPWSKWSNTGIIPSSVTNSPTSSSNSGGGGSSGNSIGSTNGKTIERKSSINALIEKLQNESHKSSASPSESSKSSIGFLSPSNSLKGRLNSVSELVDSVESRRNSTSKSNSSSSILSSNLTQSQQDEVDRKAALELDWKRAVEEAQRAAERTRLERVERKKSEDLQALALRKNSLQSMDEQMRLEAEQLRLCAELDAKVVNANSTNSSGNKSRSGSGVGRLMLTSPFSESQMSTSADLDTTALNTPTHSVSLRTPLAGVSSAPQSGTNSSSGVGNNISNSRSLRAVFGELSPVEAAEGDTTTLFVNLPETEELERSVVMTENQNHLNENKKEESEFDATNTSISFSAALEMESIDAAGVEIAASAVAEAARVFTTTTTAAAGPTDESLIIDTSCSVLCGDNECDTSTTTTVASGSMSVSLVSHDRSDSTVLDMDSILINTTLTSSPVPLVASVATGGADPRESMASEVAVTTTESLADSSSASAAAAAADTGSETEPATSIATSVDARGVPDILSPSLILEKQLAELKAARQAEKDRILANKAKRQEGRNYRLAAANEAHNRSSESLLRVSPSTSAATATAVAAASDSGNSGYGLKPSSDSSRGGSVVSASRGGEEGTGGVALELEGLNLSAELEPEASTSSTITGTAALSEANTPSATPTVEVAGEPSNDAAESADAQRCNENKELEELLEAYTRNEPVGVSPVTKEEVAEAEERRPHGEVHVSESGEGITSETPATTAADASVAGGATYEQDVSPLFGFFMQLSTLFSPSSHSSSSNDSAAPLSAAAMHAEDLEQQDILLRSVENTDYGGDGMGYPTPKNDDSQSSFFRFACVVPAFQ